MRREREGRAEMVEGGREGGRRGEGGGGREGTDNYIAVVYRT